MRTTTKITAILRSADRTRKVEVDLEPNQHIGSLVEAAIQNWRLPADAHYSLINVSRSRALGFYEKVGGSIAPFEELELQPVLVAG